MRLRCLLARAALLSSAAALAACGEGEGEGEGSVPLPAHGAGQARAAFTSAEATLVDFEWDGEVVTDWAGGAPDAIGAQLLYTVGALNERGSVGQLERLVTSSVVTTPIGGGLHRVSYHARLPVAWNRRSPVPATFALRLPRVGYWSALVQFATTYGHACVDRSAHDVDAGSFWYFYRPSGCAFAPDDAVTATAHVVRSPLNTTGKYPEYHRVWSDDLLEAVVVYGKYEERSTSPRDPGIEGYGRFIERLRRKLDGQATAPSTSTPPGIPSRPGVDTPDVTIEATLPYGKTVRVHTLLVDNVRTDGPAFDARYEAITRRADIILYHGHSGLGANIRALLEKGAHTPGQHLLFFMNGCDTFAYVDGRLREARAALNPDDPAGTKYLDMVTNAMPSSATAFASEPVLLEALIDWQTPRPYAEIFRSVDPDQVVLVTGEEDNEFTPGMPVGTQQPPPRVADAGPQPPEGGTGPRPTPSSPPSPTATAAPAAESSSPDGPPDGCACESGPRPHGGSAAAPLLLAVPLALRRRRARRRDRG